MQRQIKFRAWDGKQILPIAGLNWRELNGYGEPERPITDGVTDIDNGSSDKYGYSYFAPWVRDYDDEDYKLIDESIKEHQDFMKNVVLMQYTGLKDKNGVEIYEGDIANVQLHWVNDKLHTAKVVWREDQAMFMVAVDYKNDDGILYYELPKLRSILVIGNVHENPKLMENK